MAKFSASFCLLLVLFLFTAGKRMTSLVNANDCILSTIGGGCPDEDECRLTCTPCYRNVGRVDSFCRAAGGGILVDTCNCVMKDGAPCNPVGPPKCPNWPRSAAAATNFTSN